ncbi:Retrotransposon-derived protein PEG10 [Ceratobasidium sp. AG-Ba]|nr:Retrotransposon-derived protein PEG10 [Ceratobasidium sp. AG-Ba]
MSINLGVQAVLRPACSTSSISPQGNTLQATSQSQSLQETGAFDVLLARRAEDYTAKTKRLDTLHRAVIDASTLNYIYEQPQEAATHQARIRRRRRRVRTRSQASNAIEAPIPQRPIQVTEQIEAPPQIRIEERPANPTPPRPHSSSPAPEEVPPEGDEYERLLNGPIEDIRRAAARDPTLGFFFRVLDDIKDQLLEGITAQIQVQENRQDTGVQTLNTTLQQMTNSISKLEASTGNIRQQVESAAQNAWTAANSSQLGVNEQIKTQNAIDKLSQQMDTIVVAMGAMGKQVSAALNKQEEAIKRLKADTETLQETLQVVEERVSNIDIMDQDHQWEPEAKSSRAQAPKRPQGLFPGDNPPGPPSGPPSRGNTPPPRTPKPPRKDGSTKDEIPKGARAKKPEAFNGKRGQEAEIFLMKMEIYFNDYGTAFDNNRKMATFLTNMGEGEAAKWAKPLLRKILDEESYEKERAIQNIHKLQQTGSAQHYVTAFRTLMQELDWDEHAFIDVFKKGLKNNVQQELLKATITQDTSTFSLEKWMEVSIRIDDLLFTGRSLRDNGSSGNQDRKFQPRTTKAKAGIVPPEVIQKRREEGRCIKCGRMGHRMRDCKFKEWQQETQTVKGKEAKIEEVKEEEKSSDSESEN